MRQKAAAAYEVIRLDTNNDCNLHCVYCHNPRSSALITLDEFRRFLDENVQSVRYFQIGCVMEPTLDHRMCDFMEAIAASHARPGHVFRLQTNGILLHRHDYGRMADAGLNLVTVSVDSINPENHKSLRDGTSLSKVQRNLISLRSACPSVKLRFITTVTSLNIGDIEELIVWGLDHGIEGFELRQMFHHPGSPIVDHGRMKALIVSDDAFSSMRDRVNAKFVEKTKLNFQFSETTMNNGRAIVAAST